MASGTRDRILDAARARFARSGFDGTTVTDIEADAGLASGSGSFYRHFRSKDDVFAAVVEREIDRAGAAQDRKREHIPSAATSADVRIGLALEFQRTFDALDRLDPLIAILARERGRFPELFDRVQQVMIAEGLQVDAALLGELADRGALPRRDPLAVSAVIVSAVVGYHLADRFFGGPPAGVERTDYIAALVDLLAPTP